MILVVENKHAHVMCRRHLLTAFTAVMAPGTGFGSRHHSTQGLARRTHIGCSSWGDGTGRLQPGHRTHLPSPLLRGGHHWPWHPTPQYWAPSPQKPNWLQQRPLGHTAPPAWTPHCAPAFTAGAATGAPPWQLLWQPRPQ